MAELGMVYDVDTIKRQLVETNRDYNNQQTWKGLFQGTNLGAATAQQALRSDYGTAVGQAYSAYLANQTAVKNTNIVGSGKQALDLQNQLALEQAYAQYSSQLQSGQADIEKQRIETMGQIDTALSAQATHIKDYATAHMDYLQYLGETQPELFESKQWQKYMITDETTGETRLMTNEELLGAKKNEAGEETGLFDSDGNLTLKGVDFFDQIQNAPELFKEGSTPFSRYLSDTNVDYLMNKYELSRTEAQKMADKNSELYEWSQSYNPYNWTEDPRNKGSFRTMVGLASTDEKYSFIERFGGFTDTEIDDLYDEFQGVVDKVSGLDLGKHGKNAVEDIKTATTQVFDLARDLGIDGHLKDAGFDEDGINYVLTQALSAMKTDKEMDSDWWNVTLTGAGLGAAVGAKYAAVITAPANAVPLYGQAAYGIATAIGAIVGAFVGGFSGGTIASGIRNRQEAENKQKADSAKNAYVTMLAEMVNYSKYISHQAKTEFTSGTKK